MAFLTQFYDRIYGADSTDKSRWWALVMDKSLSRPGQHAGRKINARPLYPSRKGGTRRPAIYVVALPFIYNGLLPGEDLTGRTLLYPLRLDCSAREQRSALS